MVTPRRPVMIHRQPRMDRIGVTGYPGTLNPRGRSGAVRRSTITPIGHHEEGDQRPDAGHLGQEVDRQQPGQQADHDRHDDRVVDRGQRAGVDLREERAAASRRGPWRTGCGSGRRSSTRVTLKIEITAPAASTVPGQVAPVTSCEDGRQSRLLALEPRRRLGGDGDDGDRQVDRRHHDQRDHDGQRHGPAGVVHLLAGGGHRVQADVGEEDDPGGGGDPGHAERRERREVAPSPSRAFRARRTAPAPRA